MEEQVTNKMKYNRKKLIYELEQAEIPFDYVSGGRMVDGDKEAGFIQFLPITTTVQKNRALQIKKNHIPYSYRQERKKVYPYWGDQLDMIYWDKVNGTTLWRDMIADIKKKIPKV